MIEAHTEDAFVSICLYLKIALLVKRDRYTGESVIEGITDERNVAVSIVCSASVMEVAQRLADSSRTRVYINLGPGYMDPDDLSGSLVTVEDLP